MDILRLDIRDFMSHQDTSVSFSQLPPLTLILGSNNDRPHDSNGAGKSTIFEAVSWCLFGETIREISASDLIRHGQPSCSVHMIVSLEGAFYEVTRTKKAGDSGSSEFVVKYDKVWGGSIAEKQQRLNQVLGMDFSLFRNTYLFGQAEGSEFLSATDKGRKEFVCRLLGAGVLEVAKKKASDAALVASRTLDAAKAKVRATETQLAGIEVENKVDLDALKSEADTIKAQRAKLMTKLDPTLSKRGVELAQEKSAMDRKVVQASSALTSAKAVVASVGVLEEVELDDADVACASTVADAATAYANAKGSSATKQACQRQASEIQERIKEVEAVDQCPFCLSVLKGEPKQALLVRLTADLQKMNQEISDAEYDRNQNTRVARYKSYLETKERARVDEEAVKERARVAGETLKELLVSQKALAQKLDGIEASLNEQADLDVKINVLNRDISGIETAIGRVEAQREMRAKLESELEVAKTELVEKERDALVWATLSEAFGQHGLRSLLLDRAIPILEAETNNYLRELSSKPVSIEMDSKVETKSGSVQDKLDIRVIVGQEKQPLNGCSGGEKRRVVLALRLALSKILRLHRGERAKSTMLFVDEITDDLDQDGLQRALKLLQSSEENFGRVLIISHDERLRNMVGNDAALWVESKNGVSHVKVG